jgi:fibronectin type 3 domain-containing protein
MRGFDITKKRKTLHSQKSMNHSQSTCISTAFLFLSEGKMKSVFSSFFFPLLALCFFLSCSISYAAQATLTWDSPEISTDVTGYKVYYGTSSMIYTQSIDVGNTTSHTVGNLLDGQTYYFAAVAYNSAGIESGYSNEVSTTTQAAPPDTTPNQFTFTDQTNVALSMVITSNAITVSGINAAATISVAGGTYSINGGAYTSAGGTVSNGNTVTVRQTSSGSYSTTTNATITIGGVSDTFSVTTLAAPCIYALDPTSQSFTSWNGSGSVGVSVPNGCIWSAVSNAYWITITSGGGGNGNGTVNYNVAANNGTSSRSGAITIGGQTFTVTQDKPIPITCGGSLARIARTAVSYGTLQQAYDAALNNDIIQVQAVKLIGNLMVNRNISATLAGGYACDFGTDTGLYTTLKGVVETQSGGGALTIGNVIITPNVQPPTVTTGSITNKTANSATLNGTVNPRSAATTYYFEWGTTTGYGTRNPLTPVYAGKGSADVSVSVDLTGLNPNTAYHYRLVVENSEGKREGSDQTFTTPCAFTLSPITAIVTSSSGGYGATVTANSGCSWTAVSNNAAWITIGSGATGIGNGTVSYTVTANPSKDPRTGTLTIAGQTVTVAQAGAPCSYSLNSAGQSLGAWGGTGNVGVTAIGGCTWSDESNVPWITITSGGSGVGNGTVNYSVEANSGASSRSGTMSIGGWTFTVNQAAGPLSCGGLPVRNQNTGMTYDSLQNAYAAASDGHTIQAQGIPIDGNLTVNRDVSITLEGGYSCDFGAFAGINTILNVWMKTMPGSGTLVVKNFQLQ